MDSTNAVPVRVQASEAGSVLTSSSSNVSAMPPSAQSGQITHPPVVRTVAESTENIRLLSAEPKTAGSFLSEARAIEHISSGDLYGSAMRSLNLSYKDTAILSDHCEMDSSALINTLLSYLKPDWGGQKWGETMSYDGSYTIPTCKAKPHQLHPNNLIDLIQAYLLEIIGSTAMSTTRKFDLLRGQ
jgi:hypothetical protein